MKQKEVKFSRNQNNKQLSCKIMIAIIGIIKNTFEKLTPIASAIPIIRLAWRADIIEIASILPSAIDDLEIGDVKALLRL